MNHIVDRIKEIIDEEKISVRTFEAKIGVSQGSINKSINTRSNIKSSIINKIVEIYPQYNSTWLLSGIGDKLATKKEVDPVAIVNNDSACLLCVEKDKRIDQLERIIARNEKEIDWLRNQIDCNEEPKSKRHSA